MIPVAKKALMLARQNQLSVEDVFSIDLYTGNGSAQTITNGIDLAGEGGLVWLKGRSASSSNWLVDTERGVNLGMYSNSTNAELDYPSGVTGVSSSGFTLGSDVGNFINYSGNTYVSWTFRRAPKFFDVVTYTGDGTVGREIAHELGAAPGAMFVKRTDDIGTWYAYHRGVQLSGDVNGVLVLNDTAPSSSANGQYIFGVGTAEGDFRAPTETDIIVNTTANASGATYVAYLFAHEAGGFGTEDVISCGSYTGTGTTLQIDCGFTSGARFVMIKRVDSAGDWYVWDTARGIVAGNDPYVLPNSAAAEVTSNDYIDPHSAGFEISSSAPTAINASGGTFVFLAIA